MSVKIVMNQGDFAKVKSKMAKLKSYSEKGLSTEIKRTIMDIDSRAKQKVPIAKKNGGNLKRSFKYGVQNKTAYIENFAKYAAYVEFGTGGEYSGAELDALDIPRDYSAQFKGKSQDRVHLPARPFLFNSVREALPQMYKRIVDKLNKI